MHPHMQHFDNQPQPLFSLPFLHLYTTIYFCFRQIVRDLTNVLRPVLLSAIENGSSNQEPLYIPFPGDTGLQSPPIK
jgi:hypothetical protein